MNESKKNTGTSFRPEEIHSIGDGFSFYFWDYDHGHGY